MKDNKPKLWARKRYKSIRVDQQLIFTKECGDNIRKEQKMRYGSNWYQDTDDNNERNDD